MRALVLTGFGGPRRSRGSIPIRCTTRRRPRRRRATRRCGRRRPRRTTRRYGRHACGARRGPARWTPLPVRSQGTQRSMRPRRLPSPLTTRRFAIARSPIRPTAAPHAPTIEMWRSPVSAPLISSRQELCASTNAAFFAARMDGRGSPRRPHPTRSSHGAPRARAVDGRSRCAANR